MTANSWVPPLPDGWQKTTLRRMGRIFAGGTPDRKNEFYWSGGDVPWLNSGAVNQGVITQPTTFITKQATMNGATRWVAPKSVLIALAGQGKTKGMSARTEIRSTFNQSLAAIEPDGNLDYRYLHYWVQSNYQNIRNLAGGDLRDGLNLDHIGSIEIPLPPRATQRDIADYLDHETTEIDKLIGDLQSFDTIYTERQMAQVSSLIAYPADLSTSHACASGIVKAKYLGGIALGKMLDARQEDADSTTHPYLRAANVQPMGKLALEDIKHMRFTHREAAHLTIKGGDVLVVEGGVGGYGRAAYVSGDIPETGFQNSILRLRPHAHADGRFITYALLLLRHRGYMKMAASVTSMPHFTVDKLANTPIPLMNLARQTEIADELDAMWQRVDSVRDEGKRAITLARERRAALITAAVTGQIDLTARNKPAAEQLEDDIAQGLHREN